MEEEGKGHTLGDSDEGVDDKDDQKDIPLQKKNAMMSDDVLMMEDSLGN